MTPDPDPDPPRDTSPGPAPEEGPREANDDAGRQARRLLRIALEEVDEVRPSNPPAPTAAEIAERLPRFEVLALVGRGGMGAVYRARQKGLDREVALKVMREDLGRDPSFAERFRREARTLARLDHPSIVRVHEAGEEGGLCYLVMEWVDGVDLRRVLRTGGLPPERALAIVPQICDALHYAHARGVVHRDIKPENLLLDRSGNLKVTDFGLAKLVEPERLDVTLTRTDQVMGTPHYMAPEQIEHPLEVDHRADIYSLGVVFYELLTGGLPLGRFEPPSHKAAIDVRVDPIVMRTLEREPAARYQAASEVREDVDHVRSGVAGPRRARSPRPEDSVTRSGALGRRAGWSALAGYAVVWLAGVFLFDLGAVALAGVALALCVVGALVMRAQRRGAPAAAQAWRSLSAWRRADRALGSLLAWGLAVACVVGAHVSTWERRELDGLTRPASWIERYAGAPHRLLREHGDFTVLEDIEFVAVGGHLSTGPLLRSSLAWGLLFLLWILVAHLVWTPGRERLRSWREGWLGPVSASALAVAGLLVAELVCAVPATARGHSATRVRDAFVADGDAAGVHQRVAGFLEARGYRDVAGFDWQVATVPEGSTVGRVGVRTYADPWPLDRWRLTARGPRRVRPGVTVACLESAGSGRVRVSVDLGLLADDAPARGAWRTLLDDLRIELDGR